MADWRRLVSGVALGVVVVIAIAAAAAAKLPGLPAWGAASVAGAALAAGLFLDPFKRTAGEWIDKPRRQRKVLEEHLRMRGHDGRPRRVRACTDAVALGVHPAATDASARQGLPPYVRRDVHEDLAQAFAAGGVVIVEGRSASGKSRLAYEAMHEYAPGRWLIVPETTEALREIRKAGVPLRQAVVWLDDLDRYLAGGGLDAGILDVLCPPGRSDVLLLATLRSEARRDLAAPELGSSVKRASEEVFDRARTVTLHRDLDAGERARAERLRDDPRIADALDQADRELPAGFAEYLAAGPAALRRWRAARDGEHPVAGAIISAAVDVRRAGIAHPVPRALLEELHRHYLAPRDRSGQERLPGFADGLLWASEPVSGASACLVTAGDGRYEAFDYLTDHTQHSGTVADVPGVVWETLVRDVRQEDAYALAFAAYHAGQIPVSESGYRIAAATGHATAMNNLAVLLDETGRSEEAETWWRRAIVAGHVTAMRNLGTLLKETGRRDEAETWYLRAIDAGHLTAMHNLAVLLAGDGRDEEAETWWRRAAERGHHTAMDRLATALRRRGRTDEAEEWWRRAADAGHANAMRNLGELLKETGREAEGERWLRQADGREGTE
jgi:Tfp pilus assembly protein PilF